MFKFNTDYYESLSEAIADSTETVEEQIEVVEACENDVSACENDIENCYNESKESELIGALDSAESELSDEREILADYRAALVELKGRTS